MKKDKKSNQTASGKFIVLFVEGETDFEFYKKLIEYLKSKYASQNIQINNHKIYNVKGIGNYASKVPGKFKNEIVPKYGFFRLIVFCSYDNDVFKFSPKPPVDWDEVKRRLLDSGAEEVYFIVAKDMIEDWFLFDVNGLCTFLKIKVPKKIKGKNGYEKMNFLFKKANKIYEKGTYTYKFIASLDIDKIYTSIKTEIQDFERELFT